MNLKIVSVILKDFRSFENAELKLDDVTVLVGANNVGKTNFLQAVELLPPEKPISVLRDLRRGSTAGSPEIIYNLEFVSPPKLSLYDTDLPKKISIKKTDSQWVLIGEDGLSIALPQFATKLFKNGTGSEIDIGEVKIPNGKIISEKLLTDEQKQTLVPPSDEEVKTDYELELLNTVKSNIPAIQNIWNPDDADFIVEETPISQLLLDENLPLSRLFSKAFETDKNVGDFRQILLKGISSEIHSFCIRATKSINTIFETHWKFRPSIKLNITPSESSIKVYFDQGDVGLIEPLFSSDGLKWLVSYFIRFGMTDVENRLILLDQPGDKLYPGGQKDLIRLIEGLSKHNQIIYTTHSPFMIGKSKLGRNIRIISKPTDGNGNQTGYSTVANEIKEMDIRQSDLLNNALGFFWTDFVPVGEFNVLMEGKLDAAVVINTEKQKAIKNGNTNIDFDSVVIRGVRGASYIGPTAESIKKDGKNVLGVYDSDWNNKIVELDSQEIIKLNQVNGSWSDIEDLIPTDYIKEVFQQISNDTQVAFQYRKTMDGPGRGKKIKQYLRKKEPEVGSKRLIEDFEMKMIDIIQQKVNNDVSFPKEFYDLNKSIIKHITYKKI